MGEYGETQIVAGLALYRSDPFTSINFEDALEDTHYFMDGNGDMSPLEGALQMKGLIVPFLGHFGYWVATAGQVKTAELDVAQRAAFFEKAVTHTLFQSNPSHVTPSLPQYGETLLQLIATGRADLLAATEQIALSVLKSGRYAPPEGTTGYFSQPSKVGVFALEMLAQQRDETVDWESFHVPPDRFWLDAARLGLNDPDPQKGAEWARELCAAHMRTLATDVENGSMDASTGHEIREEAHFLWPITTIAFLRMRASLGHQTGPVDHPLMRTSFQVLHDWQVPAGSWPGAPWWTDILDRTAAIAPALTPQIALVR
ncbi:hypothetical protein [Yoonia sp. SS1-5]|uniref:Uncharacterized protein n=1 Tax=Yoonia rhodophyticola TaxID=3137370 RepID=A0AAN0MBL3_9RHOB